MPKINWANTKKKDLYFRDLQVGEHFVNISHLSKGAVYVKIENNDTGCHWMLELATSYMFQPTSSPVERVEVEYNVNRPKPSIY